MLAFPVLVVAAPPRAVAKFTGEETARAPLAVAVGSTWKASGVEACGAKLPMIYYCKQRHASHAQESTLPVVMLELSKQVL